VNVVYDKNLCLPQHWAYAKIKTYSMQTKPFIHVDGDVYLPQPIPEDIANAPLIAQNKEIGTDYYKQMMEKIIQPSSINMSDYLSDGIKEESVSSYNMGIFGGSNLAFIKKYCEEAQKLCDTNKNQCLNGNFNLLFEQILFAYMVKKENLYVGTIFPQTFIFCDNNIHTRWDEPYIMSINGTFAVHVASENKTYAYSISTTYTIPEEFHVYDHIWQITVSELTHYSESLFKFAASMKRLAFIILLLAWAHGLCAQTTVKSADVVEKEDSMRMLSITPVHHPKSLVKQIFKRLKRDMKQQHGSRRYKIEGDFRIDPFPPFSASCIYPVESDNGLEIQEGNRLEEFCYKGVEKLSPGDSAFIRGQLLKYLCFSPVHSSEYYNEGHYPPSPFVFFDETNRWYKIKAFKISYGENSVYRVHLDKKKIAEYLS
jgi:hypothetical protein